MRRSRAARSMLPMSGNDSLVASAVIASSGSAREVGDLLTDKDGAIFAVRRSAVPVDGPCERRRIVPTWRPAEPLPSARAIEAQHRVFGRFGRLELNAHLYGTVSAVRNRRGGLADGPLTIDIRLKF